MNGVEDKLKNLKPEHDTPVGLIHPYWARKPLNVIQELITFYSEDGDVVADPFVGSGTTAFAALSKGRKVVASDLNPLAIFLTNSIISLRSSPEKKILAAKEFVNDFCKEILPLFHYRDDFYVERERFQVTGSFKEGNFELIPTEVVLKKLKDQKLTGRKAEKPCSEWINSKNLNNRQSKPIDFKTLNLVPNSRIAIPSGATLAHYYHPKNQFAINLALDLINSGKYGSENEDVLKLLLSASLPLLRLSDKKASSQWPYWRPKKQLTSRNPVPVFQKKLQSIKQAIEWLKGNISADVERSLGENLNLFNVPIQSIVPDKVYREKADLVLTDPPYSDQAPYLEYSSLWVQLLGLMLPNNAFEKEIVKTDAPSRKLDNADYVRRLREGLKACTDILRPSGILIWFYQDHLLEHWIALGEEASSSGINLIEVVPMPKQRRSMKTVTSPGKTLDGDLILIFKKEEGIVSEDCDKGNAEKIIEKELMLLSEDATYFEKYAVIVKVGLKHNLFKELSENHTNIKEVLSKMNHWRENVLASD